MPRVDLPAGYQFPVRFTFEISDAWVKRWGRKAEDYPREFSAVMAERASEYGPYFRDELQEIFDARVRNIYTGRMRSTLGYQPARARAGADIFPILYYGYFPNRGGAAQLSTTYLSAVADYWRDVEYGWGPQAGIPPTLKIRNWMRTVAGRGLEHVNPRTMAKRIASHYHEGIHVLRAFRLGGHAKRLGSAMIRGSAQEAFRRIR